jgi:hypothetical protein
MQAIDPKGSFLKNLVLSLLLLGVSSLLVPIVLKQIDDQKFVSEQRFQDALVRQNKILDAQAALLDTMASDFWNYELYASDVVISRDPRFGVASWHQQAVAAYYAHTGALLGKMRAEISTLLQLAPRPTYEAFLRLYNEEVLPLDACLLELMKREQATPAASPHPARCDASAGTFAGASWDTLANAEVRQDLAASIDRAFAGLAQDFRLQGAPADGPLGGSAATPPGH